MGDTTHDHTWRDVTPRGAHDVQFECDCGATMTLGLPQRGTAKVNGL